ncbi:MAG: WYL domain-containing protein [Bacteroidales bacterium]|nr:WYL domain-containing protein [Bacteroidales bacterium]
MSNFSNAVLRHRTIDACLRDTSRKYTLIDLINACTAAIKEKHGSKVGNKFKVSVRSLQLDLQTMRCKTKGYGAPIVVYEQKYYKYKDPNYSIYKSKLGKETLGQISELVDSLSEYSSFNGLSSLKNISHILHEEISAKLQKRESVIENEARRNPLGLEYFDTIHDAIINKKALCIGYFSSRSNNIMSIIFYPFYLKEYKGRWYALGYKDGLNGVYKLPLDRIRDYSYSILPFPTEYTFNPDEYFKDIIGVTRLTGEPKEIKYLVKNRLAPFIKKNPLHHTQKIVYRHENGDLEFTIKIIPNREFYNLLFDFQPHIQIISPREVGLQANERVLEIVGQLPDYSLDKKKEDAQETDSWDNGINLFSNL